MILKEGAGSKTCASCGELKKDKWEAFCKRCLEHLQIRL